VIVEGSAARGAFVATVVFVAMEPVTYLVHRFVMHGPGIVLHRSHHARRGGRLEANDAFPVLFAAVTVAVMAVGAHVRGLGVLVGVGAGVTAYGVAYGFVHDVYIHGRLGRRRRVRILEGLGQAHALHHRYGGEPYGMLLPVVPAALRRRVAASGGADPRTPAA